MFRPPVMLPFATADRFPALPSARKHALPARPSFASTTTAVLPSDPPTSRPDCLPPFTTLFLPSAPRPGSAAGAVLFGFRPDLQNPVHAAGGPDLSKVAAQPNAFVRIASYDTVTATSKHHYMTQGNATGLAIFLADELEADWAQVRPALAPAAAALYIDRRSTRLTSCHVA